MNAEFVLDGRVGVDLRAKKYVMCKPKNGPCSISKLNGSTKK